MTSGSPSPTDLNDLGYSISAEPASAERAFEAFLVALLEAKADEDEYDDLRVRPLDQVVPLGRPRGLLVEIGDRAFRISIVRSG